MCYKTVKSEAEASFVEKKSEFIGHIAPVKTNEEATAFIEKIRSQNRKARHNVYAYILRDSSITRYSDDSEPQGTGGIPVLEILKHEGLCDVCVVVTRYFGGILLGTGGLTRAYSHACKLAVDTAEIMNMFSAKKITVRCDYSTYGKLNTALSKFETAELSSDFSDAVRVSFFVKSFECEHICTELSDASNGRCGISVDDERYIDFK